MTPKAIPQRLSNRLKLLFVPQRTSIRISSISSHRAPQKTENHSRCVLISHVLCLSNFSATRVVHFRHVIPQRTAFRNRQTSGTERPFRKLLSHLNELLYIIFPGYNTLCEWGKSLFSSSGEGCGFFSFDIYRQIRIMLELMR